jgi:unsaturated chondroitin disaccharide hydrolase
MRTPVLTGPRNLPPSRALAYDALVAKIRRNIVDLVAQPTTWSWAADGDYSTWNEGFFEIGNWTTSFHTGMALIAWNETKDDHFLDHVLELEPLYRAKIDAHAADTMHDLGFLYSLYSVALYKLTGEERHRECGIKAAETLAARFRPAGDYLRAWGRMDEEGTDWDAMAIIDCMMNLPLLYWASEETGDPRFKDIAVRHADTTLKCFIREDDTVFHAYRFDPITGAPTTGENYCGYHKDSHWARGTAWAIYGFAMSYRYTREQRFLDASLRVARKFLSLLDDEIVPPWDFRLPDDPALPIRDSSAAAIAVCGFQELEALGWADASLRAAKDAILDRLCSPDYLNTDPSVRGVLKHGQVGNPIKAYTSWGDYYLMEALARETGMILNWW